MLKYFLILLWFALAIPSSAQSIDFEKIQDINFKTKQDYLDFEDELLVYLEWLENHSIDHKDRIKVNAVILKWAEGTSSVMITVESYLMDYVKKNPAFMVLFIGGWSRYVLQNPDQKEDLLKCNLAAVNSFLDFYEKGKEFGVVKDKKVGKLLKKRKANKLEKWLSKKID